MKDNTQTKATDHDLDVAETLAAFATSGAPTTTTTTTTTTASISVASDREASETAAPTEDASERITLTRGQLELICLERMRAILEDFKAKRDAQAEATAQAPTAPSNTTDKDQTIDIVKSLTAKITEQLITIGRLESRCKREHLKQLDFENKYEQATRDLSKLQRELAITKIRAEEAKREALAAAEKAKQEAIAAAEKAKKEAIAAKATMQTAITFANVTRDDLEHALAEIRRLKANTAPQQNFYTLLAQAHAVLVDSGTPDSLHPIAATRSPPPALFLARSIDQRRLSDDAIHNSTRAPQPPAVAPAKPRKGW